MKQLFKSIILLLCLLSCHFAILACSVTNGGACICADGSDNCALLPDIVIAESPLLDSTQNVEKRGELRITVSTPNIGYGPLHIKATNYYICGTDTIFTTDDLVFCPDEETSQQLIRQIIYQKSGEENLTVTERWAGAMAYHPTHAHMHVNDWCAFSIRSKGEGSDPTDWPVVAEGRKIGFCLRDSGTCDDYDGHCVDTTGKVLKNNDLPNFQLGGGQFTCNYIEQGISVGYSDIYDYWLDDMDIQIPDTVCNGDYYLVVVADPLNHFEESNEDNNTLVIPITLSKQQYEPDEIIRVSGNRRICKGDTLVLSAEAGTAFKWSTGETTQSITVTEAGAYSVEVITPCQTVTSSVVDITYYEFSPLEISVSDTLCTPNQVTLNISTGDEQSTFFWYDGISSYPIFEGNTFETPMLNAPYTYYVVQEEIFEGETYSAEPQDNKFGNSTVPNPNFNAYLIFDAHEPFTLLSVKVYSDTEGERLIQFRDSTKTVLQEKKVNIPVGESRITLDFDVPKGENFQLAAAEFPYLERNNSKVNYPYGVDKLLTIKGSSLDDPVGGFFYYYFFYNWEIKKADYSCTNERIAVETPVKNCVGVTDIATQTVNIFPNPNQGKFLVEWNEMTTENTQLSIFNTTGKAIFQQNFSPKNSPFSEIISLNHLPTGIYLLEITMGSVKKYEKVVIQL